MKKDQIESPKGIMFHMFLPWEEGGLHISCVRLPHHCDWLSCCCVESHLWMQSPFFVKRCRNKLGLCIFVFLWVPEPACLFLLFHGRLFIFMPQNITIGGGSHIAFGFLSRYILNFAFTADLPLFLKKVFMRTQWEETTCHDTYLTSFEQRRLLKITDNTRCGNVDGND